MQTCLSGQCVLDMFRTYKRKTERGAYGYDILKDALLPLKTVSRLYHVTT